MLSISSILHTVVWHVCTHALFLLFLLYHIELAHFTLNMHKPRMFSYQNCSCAIFWLNKMPAQQSNWTQNTSMWFTISFCTNLSNFHWNTQQIYGKYIEFIRENDDGAPYSFFTSHLTAVVQFKWKKFGLNIARELKQWNGKVYIEGERNTRKQKLHSIHSWMCM